MVDGIERSLGWRGPWRHFWRGADCPWHSFSRGISRRRTVTGYAGRSSRILHNRRGVEGRLVKVSALARERMGGLQSIAAEPHRPRVTLVGHRWDTASSSLRRFLARNQISFHWLTPEATELSTHWPGTVRRETMSSGALRGWTGSSCGRSCATSQITSAFRPAQAPLNTTWQLSEEAPRVSPRQSTVHRKDCAQSSSSEKPPGARPARLRVLRTISDFRVAFRVTNLLAARSASEAAWL